MSAMVSPRPSCISAPVSMIVSPPSSRMATSKDTRVRVDGLSKIIASVLPASGRSARRSPRLRRALHVGRRRRECARSSSAANCVRSRKCRGLDAGHSARSALAACGALDLRAQARVEPRRTASPTIGLVDDQRRQQPHDVVAGRHGRAASRRARPRRTRYSGRAFDAEQQAFAADLLDDRGVAVLQLGEALLQHQADALDILEEAWRQHDVEHGIADRHGERIAAEGRAVRAGRHALARFARRQAGAEREAAADALGDRHDVGRRRRRARRQRTCRCGRRRSGPRRRSEAGHARRRARAGRAGTAAARAARRPRPGSARSGSRPFPVRSRPSSASWSPNGT